MKARRYLPLFPLLLITGCETPYEEPYQGRVVSQYSETTVTRTRSGPEASRPAPLERPRQRISETRTTSSPGAPEPVIQSRRETVSTPAPPPPPPKPTPAPVAETAPFGSPVPGKPGYVTSPFSPSAGYIDVTGLAPGSYAKDPYSGKLIRVP